MVESPTVNATVLYGKTSLRWNIDFLNLRLRVKATMTLEKNYH